MMTEREKLHKKQLLLNYAERIGMEVLADYGSYLAVGFPIEKHDLVVQSDYPYKPMLMPQRKELVDDTKTRHEFNS